MEKIPKYSYDLIDELDRDTPKPELPKTALHWHQFNADTARIAAFAAGQRAIVDLLIDMRREIEEGKVHAQGGVKIADVDPDDPLGTVLDPDGNPHQTVASTHVAARLVDSVPNAQREASDVISKS